MEKRAWVAGVGLALLLGLWLSFDQSAVLAAQEHQTVRVGFYAMDGFHAYDAQNNLSGYDVDYLKKITDYTGWQYAYHCAPSFGEALTLLEDGKVDLIGGVPYDPKLAERFAYSAYPQGRTYEVLLALKDNEGLIYEDFQGFGASHDGAGVRIGYLAMGSDLSILEKYRSEHPFTCQMMPYESLAELQWALDSGQVDAILASLVQARSSEKMVAKLVPQEFYYLTRQDDAALLAQLDSAIVQVDINAPEFTYELQVKHYPSQEDIPLTKAELTYIAEAPVFTVGIMTNRAPLAYQDPATGELAGITLDIVQMIADISGLQFKMQAMPEGNIDYWDLQKAGIDLLSTVEINEINQTESGLALSAPYLTSQKVVVGRKGEQFSAQRALKIGVIKGSQTINQVIHKAYPNFEIIKCNTVQEGLEQVRRGKIDVMIGNQYVVEQYLHRPQYEYLVVIPGAGMAERLAMSPLLLSQVDGAQDPILADERLLTIINKAIHQIEEEDIAECIIQHTTAVPYQISWQDFVYKYRFFWVTLTLLLVVVGVGFSYASALKKRDAAIIKSEKEKVEAERERYALVIEQSDDVIFDINLIDKTVTHSAKADQVFGTWSDEYSMENYEAITHCIHPEDRGKFAQMEEELHNGEQKVLRRIRLQKADGLYLWCDVQFGSIMKGGQIARLVGRVTVVDDLVKEHEALTKMSRDDALTGLYNKATFSKICEDYLDSMVADKHCALIFVDVDNFKLLNDTNGHLLGDDVLKNIALTLKRIFRAEDVIGRFGGDEFYVFVKQMPDAVLQQKAEAICRMTQACYGDGGSQVEISASVGIARTPQDGTDFAELLERADQALYSAKAAGKNHYVIYGAS